MTKDAYPALFHYIHKQIADVDFPVSKARLLEIIGDRQVYVDWNTQLPLRSFVDTIPQQEFSCAADFYCMLIAAL